MRQGWFWLSVMCAMGLGACAPDGYDLPITVTGLSGELALDVSDGTTTQHGIVHDGTQLLHHTFARDAVLEVSLPDQPDRPAQRCTLSASVLEPGRSLEISCTRIAMCERLLRQFPRAVTAFPGLSAPLLMELEWTPGGRFYLATTMPGTVARFEPTVSPTELVTVLDITDRVEVALDDGMLSATLHPSYPSISSLFALYVSNASPRTIRLSRFELGADGIHYDPATEDVLLEGEKVPDTLSHSGGVVRFGPDGYLYVTFGDGGFVVPPVRNAQDTTSLLGKMLRIDVDVPAGTHYRIPDDNPFVESTTDRPEIFAWGLRNPFRWSFDAETGAIWEGDVGWASWEEINVIERGGNYGWPVMEGGDCVDPGCDVTAFREPVLAIPHELGSSAIVGGFVYHGTALPELSGAYLFSDFNRHALFALMAPYGSAPTMRTVVAVDDGIVWVGPDEHGEPLLVGLEQIFRIEPGAEGRLTPPPASILDTGCMDLDDPTSLHPAFERYEVNVPLWSDGAGKERYALLPEGTTATFDEAGDLTLPPGTLLVKEFYQGHWRLETRFLAQLPDGSWNSYTYRWNDDQSDAQLVAEPTLDGGWLFPSSTQCQQCHTGAAGHSLGLELPQLDRTIEIRGEQVSQLDRWRALGWLPETLPSLTAMRPIDGDEEEDVSEETRIRDYLHANCSHCHRPGNVSRAQLDLRRQTPLAMTGLCDAPHAEAFGVAHIIEPGSPDASLLVLRMGSTGPERMPPLGRATVDESALEHVREWIRAMPSCP